MEYRAHALDARFDKFIVIRDLGTITFSNYDPEKIIASAKLMVYEPNEDVRSIPGKRGCIPKGDVPCIYDTFSDVPVNVANLLSQGSLSDYAKLVRIKVEEKFPVDLFVKNGNLTASLCKRTVEPTGKLREIINILLFYNKFIKSDFNLYIIQVLVG